MPRRKKSRKMRYEDAPDIQEKMIDIVNILKLNHVDVSRVSCIRSFGSSTRRTIARCHALGKLMQKALGISAHYAIEFLECFDKMDKKGLIHKITDDLGITKYALCIDGSCVPNQHKCEHIHFKCLECGKIYCISLGNMPKIKLPETFTIQNLAISARGICENCNI